MTRALAVSILALSCTMARADEPAPVQPQLPSPEPTYGSVTSLAWMSGCWEALGGNGRVTFHEMWMKPLGKSMIGAGRTIASGRTIFTEHLEIREDGDDVFYRARPQDAPAPVPFKLTKQGDGTVLFENPGHDFPTKISYERLPEGGMRARVDGPPDAKEKPQEFVYRRISCE